MCIKIDDSLSIPVMIVVYVCSECVLQELNEVTLTYFLAQNTYYIFLNNSTLSGKRKKPTNILFGLGITQV